MSPTHKNALIFYTFGQNELAYFLILVCHSITTATEPDIQTNCSHSKWKSTILLKIYFYWIMKKTIVKFFEIISISAAKQLKTAFLRTLIWLKLAFIQIFPATLLPELICIWLIFGATISLKFDIKAPKSLLNYACMKLKTITIQKKNHNAKKMQQLLQTKFGHK